MQKEKQQKELQIQEYICPKCLTKVTAQNGKRLSSVYCRNCMKSKRLTMLRIILPRT